MPKVYERIGNYSKNQKIKLKNIQKKYDWLELYLSKAVDLYEEKAYMYGAESYNQ